MKTTLLLILLGGLWPAPVAAQAIPGVDVGARLRVSTSDMKGVTGRVEALTGDALVLRSDGQTTSRRIPLASLTRVDISRGQQSRKSAAWSRAKWGIIIGAVPGAISLGLQHEQVGEHGSSTGKAAALGAWSGGLFGGLIGGLVGAAHPSENWERIR